MLFADELAQARTFSMEASYLDISEKEEYHGTNFAFLGPEMSRPFRALKLWMMLKYRGVEGYRRMLSQGCECAVHLHERVAREADLVTVQEPNLFIYSFRYVPADLQGRAAAGAAATDVDAYADWLNQAITDELRFTGLAYVTTTEVQGNVVIRFSICSHRTTPGDIDVTVDAILKHGERIDSEERAQQLGG